MVKRIWLQWLLFVFVLKVELCSSRSCLSLQTGQYFCRSPDLVSSKSTDCLPDGSVNLRCRVRKGIICDELDRKTNEFIYRVTDVCSPKDTYEHSIALTLSIFLGFLGADRFYLGYYTIGVLKLMSMGFFLILYVVDIVLIALKLVGPSDGSDYGTSANSPISLLRTSNRTSLLLYDCFQCFRD